MTMAQTSLLAYGKVKLTKNEGIVYDALGELGVATNDAIASHLDWPIHCVTGRTNSLWTKGFIAVIDHSGVSRLGNPAKRWGVVDPNDKKLKQIAEQECGV